MKLMCQLCGKKEVEAENECRMLVCRECLEDPVFKAAAEGDWR